MGSKERKGFPSYKRSFSFCSVIRIARLLQALSTICASRVLTQKLGPHHRPVAYHSTQLDPVAAGNDSCVRVIAATVTTIESRRPLVLGHPTTVYVPREVELILKQHATQALSPQRAHRCELTILNAGNVTLKRRNVLNPATLLPAPSDGEPHHDCAKVVFRSSCLQEDLWDQTLENLDLTLSTDGSSHCVDGKRHAAMQW